MPVNDKEYFKKWRKENSKHVKEYHKNWRHSNNYSKEYYLKTFTDRKLPDNPKYISRESGYIGKQFGQWLILDEVVENTNKRRYFLAECSCGTVKYIQKYTIIKGKSTSCGCWRR